MKRVHRNSIHGYSVLGNTSIMTCHISSDPVAFVLIDISKMTLCKETWLEQHHHIKLCMLLGWTFLETTDLLQEGHGSTCLKKTSVWKWCSEFRKASNLLMTCTDLVIQLMSRQPWNPSWKSISKMCMSSGWHDMTNWLYKY